MSSLEAQRPRTPQRPYPAEATALAGRKGPAAAVVECVVLAVACLVTVSRRWTGYRT